MKALVWKGTSLMEMEESPRPDLRPGWVLLAVEDSGICGSEIGAFLGHNELRRPPMIMGHEFSGVVVETGPDVPKEWQGQLVTVNPILSCGQCRACRRGLETALRFQEDHRHRLSRFICGVCCCASGSML